MSEGCAGLQFLARPARAGGGGRSCCEPAGAARMGGEERMQWGLQTLAVGRKRREVSAAQSGEDGQRGAWRGGKERRQEVVVGLMTHLNCCT